MRTLWDNLSNAPSELVRALYTLFALALRTPSSLISNKACTATHLPHENAEFWVKSACGYDVTQFNPNRLPRQEGRYAVPLPFQHIDIVLLHLLVALWATLMEKEHRQRESFFF